jgi:transcription elongation factor Elf1
MTGVKRGPHSPEWAAAISAAKKGRSNGREGYVMSDETKAKISAANSGPGGGNWKGDEAGYMAVHDRLRKVLPRVCTFCGSTKSLECALKKDAIGPLRTDQIRVSGKMRTVTFSTRVDDYMRLCRPCHRRYDLAKE